ncbi:hypothetical protein ACHAWF_012551 [Thalassiosira exigua]
MFGQAPATSPFGAPAPAPFGAPAPAPAFGAPAPPAFGQPSPAPAPAFGGFGQPAPAPAAGGFGAPAPAAGGFGAPAPAPGGFGAPAAPAAPAFGQPAPAPGGFGQPTGFGAAAPAPAFGAPAPAAGGPFGGAGESKILRCASERLDAEKFDVPTSLLSSFVPPAPAFGSPAPAPAFGAKPAGGGLFGSAPAAPSGGLFGSAPAPAPGGLFGSAPAPPATPFGAPAAAPSAFGAPAPSAFGAPAPAAGGFGAAPAPGGFGQPQPQQLQAGSTVAPYQTTSKQDGSNAIILQAITAMPQYEQKSFEELRLEDYLAGNKGTKGQAAPAPAGFGGFGAAPQPAPAFGAAPAPAFGAAPAPATGALQVPTAFVFGCLTVSFHASLTFSFAAVCLQLLPQRGACSDRPPQVCGRALRWHVSAGCIRRTFLFAFPPNRHQLLPSEPRPHRRSEQHLHRQREACLEVLPLQRQLVAYLERLLLLQPLGQLLRQPLEQLLHQRQGVCLVVLLVSHHHRTVCLLFLALSSFVNFASPTAPAFGAAPTPAFGAAPAPAGGGLFGAPAPAPATGGLFGAPAPAPATGGLFGQPAPAPSLFGQPAPAPATGGLFGASPAKPGGLFGAPAPAPAAGGLFGQPLAPAGGGLFGAMPAPAAAVGGGLYGAAAAPAVPTIPVAPAVSAEMLLAQQLAAVENQKKQLELLDAWRGNPPSGSKVVPISQYDTDSRTGWNGGDEALPYASASSSLVSYRAAPRSTAKIQPRGYAPTKYSPVTNLGKKTGSPILSPNQFVGSATKALFIKPNSLTPKPKTRLLLTNGNGSGQSPPVRAALEIGRYESPNKANVPTQELKSPTPVNASQPKPIDSTSPQMPRGTTGSPSSPAHDFYRQVVDPGNEGSPSAPPLQAENSFLPRLTKPGYNVCPSISELESMSEADLAAVTGFKVERPGYGSVAWDGAVDVRGVDIDSVVVIERKNVSVYDEAEENGTKPQRGSKLNRPAVITMLGIYPKDGAESPPEAKAKLRRKIEKSTKKMGAELLSFEEENGVWKFRVGHFSRYGLDDDDSDGSDDDINPTPSLATLDDEQESLNPAEQMKELGGLSRLHAPDEDESTSAYTDNMSTTETIDQSEGEESQGVDGIVQAGEEAYAMMTEETFEDSQEEGAIIPYDELDKTEEEEVPFPDEACYNWSSPPKQPLRPTPSRTVPSRGICSRLAEKSGLKKVSSSNIDFGMRMRRSFRVGWTPNGSFVQLKPSAKGTQVLVQSRPDIAPLSGKSPTSLPLMESHKKHSVKVSAESENAPIYSLPRCIAPGFEPLLNALEDYIKSCSACTFDSATQQAVSNSLSLLMCLYGTKSNDDGKVDEPSLLESVSIWLKSVVSGDAAKAVSAAQSNGDTYGAIFAALSGGDVQTACSLALESGNPRLSLMMTNEDTEVQPQLNDQLLMWHQSGAQSYIPISILRILSLLGGRLDIERQMYKSDIASYRVDWRRRFGMFLWRCPSSQDQFTLSKAVNKYGADISAGLAPPALPFYCNSANKATNQCLLYQLLYHFADPKAPMNEIVAPSSHSPFCHDFSASFHLVAIMTALSSEAQMSKHKEDLIVEAVASQLIRDGCWEWAVYASLCSFGRGPESESSAFAKQMRAKNIVLRFFSPSSDPFAEQRRQFLQGELSIPEEWFVEAQANRCVSEGDIFGAYQSLFKISVADSMVVMSEFLIPHMLFGGRESMKKLRMLLDILSSQLSDDTIGRWSKSSGCGMVHAFLELHGQVEELSNISLDQVESNEVDIEDLLDKAADLMAVISKAKDCGHSESTLAFAKMRYGFTKVPKAVVLAKMDEMLYVLSMKLMSIKNRQPLRDLDCGNQLTTKCSSELVYTLSPGGLFDSSNSIGADSILQGFYGHKTTQ